jgi:hypothetical protein
LAALEEKVASAHRNCGFADHEADRDSPVSDWCIGAAQLGIQEWEERFREVVKHSQKTEKVLDDEGAKSSAAWLKEKRAR